MRTIGSKRIRKRKRIFLKAIDLTFLREESGLFFSDIYRKIGMVFFVLITSYCTFIFFMRIGLMVLSVQIFAFIGKKEEE